MYIGQRIRLCRGVRLAASTNALCKGPRTVVPVIKRLRRGRLRGGTESGLVARRSGRYRRAGPGLDPGQSPCHSVPRISNAIRILAKPHRWRIKVKTLLITASIAGLLFSVPVMAQNIAASGHVTFVNPGAFPGQLWFIIDPPAVPPPGSIFPSCSLLVLLPSGTDAPSKLAFMEAAFSVLLAAKLSGST